MEKYFFKTVAIMALCILSLSSCGDDNEPEMKDQLQITLNKESLVLEIGSSEKLVAGFSPADTENQAHTWATENPQIATVDETGKVTAVSVGTTRITATALANKAKATCVVEVVDKIIPVSSITLNTKEETIVVGSITQLTATISPATATDQRVTWTSGNSAVATVDDNGLVKGISQGTATITATAGSKSAKCTITVTEKSVDFTGIKYTIQADGTLLVSGTVKPIGVNVAEIGVCFSTESTPTIENNKHVLSTGSLSINSEISDLSRSIKYYARMYAKGDGNIYYGKTEVIEIPGELTTQFKLELNYCKAVFSNISTVKRKEFRLIISTPLVEGYSNIKLCYGVAPNPEITDNITRFSVSEDKLTATLDNLEANKTYYVRAYSLKNGKPIYYPGEASFTTLGGDTDLDIIYKNGSSNSTYYYRIGYKLPEVGTYKVWSSAMAICKTIDGTYNSELYVNEGTSSIYVKSIIYSAYEKDYVIVFYNIDTDTRYELHTGK